MTAQISEVGCREIAQCGMRRRFGPGVLARHAEHGHEGVIAKGDNRLAVFSAGAGDRN
jgi:hypothetical protein